MNIKKENYTKVFIDKMIDSDNQFEAAIILFKEESSGYFFPLGLEAEFYEYLKSIKNDLNHDEYFLADRIYELDKPKSLYIELKNRKLNCFYLNFKNEAIKLNLIDILSIAIRYPVDIYLEYKLLHPEFLDDFFIKVDSVGDKKVDLYRLDKQHLENLKH